MNGIKNIIFDLGGVLLNIDYLKTTESFKKLGFTDFENMYTMLKANNVFDNLETGHISETDFYSYLMGTVNGTVSREQVEKAWNAMLLDFRTESLAHLQKLGGTHRLFLLSNTNIIHKREFDKIFSLQAGPGSVDDFFEKAYYSHHVGLRKPHSAIFEFVLQDAGLLAGETFYIDDLHPNIETAEKLGFRTHLLLPGQKIEDLDYR